MNKYDLYKSIAEVEDDMLLRTEAKTRHIHPALRGLAAALALVLGLWGFSVLFAPDAPADKPTSWFIVTAYAADEVEALPDMGTQTGTDQSFNNYFGSAGEDQYFFGADVPVFYFELNAAQWESNSDAYADFDISLSYDGVTVGVGDKHVCVAFQSKVGSTDAPTRLVMGWFLEPTDVIVTVTNTVTGAIVEKITVHVCYSEQTGDYEITVTDLQTTAGSETAADRYQYYLTEEQLASTTEELVELVLDFECLPEMLVSGISTEHGYNSLKRVFNGFDELESRPDAASVMLSRFANTPKDELMDALHLYLLLTLPVYADQLTEAEVAQLDELMSEWRPLFFVPIVR